MSETSLSGKSTAKPVIRNYEDLLREEKALQLELALQQELVAEQWEMVKQQYAPATRILSTVSKLGSGGGKGILAAGLNIGLGFLFRKTGMPVIRNLATGFVAEKAAGLISGLFKRKKKTGLPQEVK